MEKRKRSVRGRTRPTDEHREDATSCLVPSYVALASIDNNAAERTTHAVAREQMKLADLTQKARMNFERLALDALQQWSSSIENMSNDAM